MIRCYIKYHWGKVLYNTGKISQKKAKADEEYKKCQATINSNVEKEYLKSLKYLEKIAKKNKNEKPEDDYYSRASIHI